MHISRHDDSILIQRDWPEHYIAYGDGNFIHSLDYDEDNEVCAMHIRINQEDNINVDIALGKPPIEFIITQDHEVIGEIWNEDSKTKVKKFIIIELK